MKIATFVLLLSYSLLGWSQLTKDQALELIQKNSPETAAAAITASGLGFEPDEAFLSQLCEHPQVLRIVLMKLVHSNSGRMGIRALNANDITGDPDALVIQKIYELANNLTVAGRMETTPQVIDRRLGFRDFMVRTLMEPNHQITLKNIQYKLGRSDFLPTWVQSLVEASAAAKKEGYPKVTFTANRSANITLASSERGVHGYLGLFMIKGDPTATDFTLEENLTFSHPTFPMTYNPTKEVFEPGRIEKNRITTLPLTKIFKKMQPLELFPGRWGIRFKHTTGYHSLRSDRTFYFTLEAGKDYEMNFAWETSNKGLGQMSMKLIAKDTP